MTNQQLDEYEYLPLSLDPDFIRRKVASPKVTKSSFTLTLRSARILDALWERAGITAREIFDQSLAIPWHLNSDWLPSLSKKISNQEISEKRSVRKTLALSERSRLELEKVSKENDIRRDDLACAVIEQFLTSYNERIIEAEGKWKDVMDYLESIVHSFEERGPCSYPDHKLRKRFLATEIVSWPWGGKVQLDPSKIPSEWHGIIAGLLERTITDWKNDLLNYWENDEKFYWMAESGMAEAIDGEGRRFRTIRDIALHLKPIYIDGDQT